MVHPDLQNLSYGSTDLDCIIDCPQLKTNESPRQRGLPVILLDPLPAKELADDRCWIDHRDEQLRPEECRTSAGERGRGKKPQEYGVLGASFDWQMRVKQ